MLLSQKGARFEKKIDVANTLLARDYKGFGNQSMNGCLSTMEKITNKPIILGCVYDNPNNNAESGRGAVYDINGISSTILTMSGG